MCDFFKIHTFNKCLVSFVLRLIAVKFSIARKSFFFINFVTVIKDIFKKDLYT